MTTKIIKNIPLEDVANIIVKEESIIFERYNMVNNQFAKHNCKNLSIASSYTHPSDEYLDEYIETNYKKLSDGRFEADYSPFNTDLHKLT